MIRPYAQAIGLWYTWGMDTAENARLLAFEAKAKAKMQELLGRELTSEDFWRLHYEHLNRRAGKSFDQVVVKALKRNERRKARNKRKAQARKARAK